MVAPTDSVEINALDALATPALGDLAHINDIDDSNNSFKVTLQKIIELYNSLTVAAITNKTLNDSTNTIHADAEHRQIRNNSGGTLNIGDAVSVTGFHVGSSLPTVDLADADNAGAMPAVGIVEDTSIANNANGLILITGTISGMDTSFGSAGESVYVSTTGTTGNTLTTTRPTGTTAEIQKIGEILRSHATLGELLVVGAGRSNDVPNLEDAKFWVGNATNVATAVSMSGDATMTNAGVVTVTGGAGGTIIDSIPCVMTAPEGSIAYPDVHALATQVSKVSGFVLPDGATASTINFKCKVPDALNASPAAKIRITIMTLGAVAGPADVRLTVKTAATADTENVDAAFTAETETTVTMPTATETLDVYEQTLTNQPSNGDFITGQITRDPTDVADDFTDDILIVGIELIVTRDT